MVNGQLSMQLLPSYRLTVAGASHLLGQNRLNRAPSVAVSGVTVPGDADAIARGAHLARISSCAECHGANLEGMVFIDEAPIGYVPAPNLTTGTGGVGGSYADGDWARVIRHGVAADGRALVIMPADHYAHYGDEDLGALIAYLKSVPPVDNDLGLRRIDFPGTIIVRSFLGFVVRQNCLCTEFLLDSPHSGSHQPVCVHR